MHWRANFMSGRLAPYGGRSGDQPSATRSNYAPRDSILLPPGNLSLPRSEFAQAVLDVFKLLCAFLLVSATGCGIAFVFFVLLFVKT
jgi:hypothetical protein